MRYTIKALRADLERFNAELAKQGYTFHLEAESRNGYTGLDLYEGKRCQRTIETGSPMDCHLAIIQFTLDYCGET